MNRKAQFIAAIIMALLVMLLLLLRSSYRNNGDAQMVAKPLAGMPQSPPRGAVATSPPDPRDLQQVSAHPLAVTFGEKPDPAGKEPATLLEILRFYRMEFGSFPAGQENRDIMNALTGNNPGKLPVFPREHPRIDSSGNLLDAWGNAFIFHPVSSQHLEVRSKGPDGEIFTEDDIFAPH